MLVLSQLHSFILAVARNGSNMTSCKWKNDEVIQRFREYLKIPSVHPDIDYSGCVSFLKKQAELLDLPVVVHELVAKKPVVVITWEGSQPELPAILLNSHMDVVPVYEEFWTYPPFEARITDDGYIYGRGTQDMKGIAMMHLEAVRRLKGAGVRLKRTVHITFVPEIKVTSRGDPTHGCLLPANTAGEKLYYVIDKFMKLRAEQKKILDGGKFLGDVISVNLTQLAGGVQVNVIPENLTASFDIRIPPHVNHEEFEQMICSWCKEAGDNVNFEYVEKNPEVKITKIDGSIPFWTVLKDTVKDMGLDIVCVICPGATDARFVRHQGIPVINLSPILDSPMLLHAHDERIHVDIYKQGIDITERVLKTVANV